MQHSAYSGEMLQKRRSMRRSGVPVEPACRLPADRRELSEMNGKNATHRTPEFLVGVVSAVCGLLVLLIGVPNAQGRTLAAVVLIGLLLLSVGAYLIWELSAPVKASDVAAPSAPPSRCQTVETTAREETTRPQPTEDKTPLPTQHVEPASRAATETSLSPPPSEPGASDQPGPDAEPTETEKRQAPPALSPAEELPDPCASPPAEDPGDQDVPAKRRCTAVTKSGAQCKLMTDHPSGRCHIHRARSTA